LPSKVAAERGTCPHDSSGISKPRPKQAQKIAQGLHRLAREMMEVTV